MTLPQPRIEAQPVALEDGGMDVHITAPDYARPWDTEDEHPVDDFGMYGFRCAGFELLVVGLTALFQTMPYQYCALSSTTIIASKLSTIFGLRVGRSLMCPGTALMRDKETQVLSMARRPYSWTTLIVFQQHYFPYLTKKSR
jgi:hypothetical protein